jgi:hypothetical protein
LDEAAQVLGQPELGEVGERFLASAAAWEALARDLLPEKFVPLDESRRLMESLSRLFIEQGIGSIEARREIKQRLQGIRAEMETNFPLDEVQSAVMRAGLRERIEAILAVERPAIEMLRSAVG